MRKITKRLAVIGAVSALALGGGIAWAAWTVTGGGEGKATAGTSKVLVATATTSGSETALYPGAKTDVSFSVTNPNPFPVQLTGITGVVTSDKQGCDGDDVKFTAPASGLPAITAINGNATAVKLEKALEMLTTAGDECQGATFTVALTLTGQSAAQ